MKRIYINMSLRDLVRNYIQLSYINDSNGRVLVSEIYEGFRVWIMGTHGIATMDAITRRQIYAILKEIPEYPYVRCREGYCLRGLGFKGMVIAVHPIYTATLPLCEPTYTAPLNIIEPVLPIELPTIDLEHEKRVGPIRPIGLIIPKGFQATKAQ